MIRRIPSSGWRIWLLCFTSDRLPTGDENNLSYFHFSFQQDETGSIAALLQHCAPLECGFDPLFQRYTFIWFLVYACFHCLFWGFSNFPPASKTVLRKSISRNVVWSSSGSWYETAPWCLNILLTICHISKVKIYFYDAHLEIGSSHQYKPGKAKCEL